MKTIKLGRTGLDVSPLCLGCMTYGIPERGPHPWTLDEERSRPLIRKAVESGINFFDTANYYSDGTSEEIVGRALKDFCDRDAIVLATKVFYPLNDQPNAGGLSRKAIFSAIDASLRRLGTDYVDLYQIHREEEREMLPFCAEEGVAVIPWSPLARGRLTRDPDAVSGRQATDAVGRNLYDASAEADARVIAAVARIAQARGVSRAQVALAWLLSKPVVTAPIIGASRPEHLDDALAALDLSLTEDEVAALEAPYIPHAVVGFS